MEHVNIALIAGSTTRFAVVDTERDLGYTIEGTLQVKLPKNSKPGDKLELAFVADHVYPIDPLWDGQGTPPSQIKAEAKADLDEKLEEENTSRREREERAAAEARNDA